MQHEWVILNKRNCRFWDSSVTDFSQTHQHEWRRVALTLIKSSALVCDSHRRSPVVIHIWTLSNSRWSKNSISSVSPCCNDAVIQCTESHTAMYCMTLVLPWSELPKKYLSHHPCNCSLSSSHLPLSLALFAHCGNVSVCLKGGGGSEEDPLLAVSIVVYVCRHWGLQRSRRNPPSLHFLPRALLKPSGTWLGGHLCVCACLSSSDINTARHRSLGSPIFTTGCEGTSTFSSSSFWTV